MFFSQK